MTYGFLVAIAAFIALVGVSIVGTHIVYASSYEKSQMISQNNDYSNYWFPLNVLCSNVGSRVQGGENSAAIATGQAEGKVESSENFTPFP